MATQQELLTQLYLQELGREADKIDEGGFNWYLDQLDTGGKTMAQIAADFNASEEGMGFDAAGMLSDGAADIAVQDIYTQELGRTGDAGGLDFYSDLLSTGDRALDQIIAEINLSEEGRIVDPTEVIGENLVYFDPTMSEDYLRNAYATELGREADDGGLDHYLNLLNDDRHTVATILQDISRSEEGLTADPADLVFNKVLEQTIAEDSGLFKPFNDIYTDTQSFADRTASYVEESSLRDEAASALAEGDTVLADTLIGQADDVNNTRGVTPWTADGTDTIVTDDGGTFRTGTYGFDEVQADNVSGLGQLMTVIGQKAKEAGTTIPDIIGTTARDQFNNSFNYGVQGKRPDESLTQYYNRLGSHRQGGILGQGLLSADPTIGSEAWENQQTADLISEVVSMFPDQTTGIVNTDSSTAPVNTSIKQATSSDLTGGDNFIGADGKVYTVGYGEGKVDHNLANAVKAKEVDFVTAWFQNTFGNGVDNTGQKVVTGQPNVYLDGMEKDNMFNNTNTFSNTNSSNTSDGYHWPIGETESTAKTYPYVDGTVSYTSPTEDAAKKDWIVG